MKTANNNFKKCPVITSVIGMSFLLSACNSSNVKTQSFLSSTPTKTKTNITSAIQCMGKKLEQADSSRAYVFLVRDIIDGTVKDSQYQNGPLSDGGRIQMINVLTENTHSHLALVTDKFPAMFDQKSKAGAGVNRFGLPSGKSLRAFNEIFGNLVDTARRDKKFPPASSVIPLVVSGSFTRLDTDNALQVGTAHNAGSRATNDRKSGQIDYGKTTATRAITLIINLIDPRNNLVAASHSFDVEFHRNNDKKRFRIAFGDGFYGFSHNEVVVEGLHSAQKTLVDAAALWVINKTFGHAVDFKPCLSPEQSVLAGKK